MLERHLQNAAIPTDAYKKAAEIAPSLLRCGDTWQPSEDLKGILIVGKSGAGKTTLAELLGQVYGIPRTRVFKIGELHRSMQGVEDSLQIIEREVSADLEVDSIQENLIREALVSDPFILEGRLANVWLDQVAKDEPSIKDHVKSFLVAEPDDVSFSRLSKRGNGLDINEVAEITNARATYDTNRWFTEAHPQLGQVNPYDSERFDFIVDATKDIESEFYMVHDWLKENGLIRPLGPTLPQRDIKLPIE